MLFRGEKSHILPNSMDKTDFSIQIQEASETSSQWLFYIHSVKNVLKAARLSSIDINDDWAALLSWVSYHDVMAQFSIHYWRRRPQAREMLPPNLDILAQQSSVGGVLEVY